MMRLAAVLLTLALAAPATGQGSALARWTLASVPPDALLLADASDVGLLRVLQADGLRPDVRIVAADDEPDLAATWATSERPVVGTLMLDPEVFARVADATIAAAAYQRPGILDEPPFDLAASEATADLVRGADFAGPSEGIVDLGGVVLFGLLQTAVSHAQDGSRAAAERAYARAVAFARDAGHADDPLVGTAREWIDAALVLPPAAPADPAPHSAAPAALDLE